ncbi:MAG: hypothetical protein ACLR8Y_18345 [Alistipes indistinctus]
MDVEFLGHVVDRAKCARACFAGSKRNTGRSFVGGRHARVYRAVPLLASLEIRHDGTARNDPDRKI